MTDGTGHAPVQVVHRHVEAMGRRDLRALMADCADAIRLLDADGDLVLDGYAAIEELYRTVFEANPALKVELMDRINVGMWVIDEHLVTGFADGSQAHFVRVYRIVGRLIVSIQEFA